MNSLSQGIVTVIQVRVGSSRLPSKVLLPLENKPLFVRQMERITNSKLKGTVVIATTTNKEDDIIVEICNREYIECYRGSVIDLLERHYLVGLKYNARSIVKIPSDCPLISPEIIDKVLNYYITNEGKYDYVSNLHPATYPDGNDIEVMTMAALDKARHQAKRIFEREHTTPFFWENPKKFKIGNVEIDGGVDYSMSHRWTIDYSQDYDFIKSVYHKLYPINPKFGFKDIMDLLEREPELMKINANFAGINWYSKHLNELKTIKPDQTRQLL